MKNDTAVSRFVADRFCQQINYKTEAFAPAVVKLRVKIVPSFCILMTFTIFTAQNTIHL
jgi:hypothetical protein